MDNKDRQDTLIELLEERGRLSNADLMDALKVSSATLRRDLAELETDGKLMRFHGGAAHPSALRGEPSFEEKSRAAIGEKRAIAAAAADLVLPNNTVFLDAGTTCLEVGRILMERKDLTLIGNSIAFAHLAREASARIICVGGEVRGVSGALVGALALSWLGHLRADIAFVGASGLTMEGPSTTELFEAETKQALIRQATVRVLVSDATKWGRASAVRFAGWHDFSNWITAGDLPREASGHVQTAGTRVTVATLPMDKKRNTK